MSISPRSTAFYLFFIAIFSFMAGDAVAQNDNCSNATPIIIGGAGFGLGTFASSTNDLTAATVQPGETFAPAILVAGQNQKSIWYKFTLPTTRAVKVSLVPVGSAITAGDAGFAVYKTNTCLPGVSEISTKLTPIGTFGQTYHPCVEYGEYYIQVSGKASANGTLYISLETTATSALYDFPSTAYQFGVVGEPSITKYVDYAVDCQSIENASEVCTVLSNSQQYNKSTWHTFTTPAYFDYVGVLFSGTGSPTSYFFPSGAFQTFGYNLYEGDARTTPLSSLILKDGCDSLVTNGYQLDGRVYKCSDLQPNTTYTVQLFFHKDFNTNVRLAITAEGIAPTQAPQPILSLVPPSNKLGVLQSNIYGFGNWAYDQLGCNSHHSLHPCEPSLPVGGINKDYYGSTYNYNLSSYFTFTLAATSKVTISTGDNYPPYPYTSSPALLRLYAQDLSDNCTTLDTANLFTPAYFSNTGFTQDCMPPGKYTLQVSGRDTAANLNTFYYGHLTNPGYKLSLRTDLGKKFYITISVADRQPSNKYDLRQPAAFDTINQVSGAMQALVNGVTYNSHPDIFGCAGTVLPSDTVCAPGNTKAMYRQLLVPDSGILAISNNSYWNKLYKGDADALATAQNAHAFPVRITGLTPYTTCMQYTGECSGQKVCVVPGVYSHVTFGSDANIGITSQPSFKFDIVNTVHDQPSNAEDLGVLNPGVNTLASSGDYFSCKDNAVPINGFEPCDIAGRKATKAIYRQFYLNSTATVTVAGYLNYCSYYYAGTNTVFSGKATDGLAGLTPLSAPFRCFNYASTTGSCNTLEPGWYTIVSYGSGPTYADPFHNLGDFGYSSYVGYASQVTVSATPACPGPKYNRPYKAAYDSVTHQPFLIQWAPRAGHTSAYPKTDTTFILYRENFNCTVDTPFTAHPIPTCDASLTKVAYYVFRLTQESYVQIDTKNYWGAVYRGNARTDSSLFGATTLIQPCISSNGFIQLCKLQPGDYTLVLFARNDQNCNSVEPSIYIDKIGTSRFDFANNAYDFGVVPPDSLYHTGKVGDINPIDPGRAASSDIIYCTTGSSNTDPINNICGTEYNPNIYNGTPYLFTSQTYTGSIARRNIWYTFVVKEGGTVRVNVLNKTPGKAFLPRYSIYKSNVDGTIPFSTVVSTGQVDSTITQGLTYVSGNTGYYYCYGNFSEISFYRPPCTATSERYYILVDNPNTYPYDYSGLQPNAQFDVSIQIDSVNAIQPLFDHYYQASSIGTNLGVGTHTGATDNFSCATYDATDPLYGYNFSTCNKTLWYKFTTTVSGYVRFRSIVNGDGQYHYSFYDIQLYRQIIPGDSTSAGLQILNAGNPAVYDPAISGYWGQTCISPGTYYIMLPGCAMVNQYVYPQIQIFEQAGDFCSVPVLAPLNGTGTSTATAVVDCHTIGTDYGEFNPTLTCPAGAVTNEYKTSWFRIDITGTDTLDVTTYITENTNAGSTDIKYRLMNGSCGAMQERSCVQDALTQDTYKCLAPGSYWVQVFTPVIKNGYPVTGTISLNLSSVLHADTCAPINSCLSNANFQKQFDCTASEAVRFINYSTFGSAVTYSWDFGYNGQTSTAVSPQFSYPALTTSHTYHITLTVRNNGCGGQSTYTDSITIPPRPGVDLGPDVSLCNGGTVFLDATSHSGSTYQWQNGSTNPTFTVTTPGRYDYYVKVMYNGCSAWDTINVNINPLTPVTSNKYICSGDPITLNSSRGLGESHIWNTGSLATSISVYAPGIYWNDMMLNGCVIRDSFIVANAASPLGSDRQACFAGPPVVLNATTQGATGYTWQNGSTNATFNAAAPGLYWVNISFGTCSLRDSIVMSNLQPVVGSAVARICDGQSYTLPSGHVIFTGGTFNDTLRTTGGCDSVINTVNVTVQTVTTTVSNATICPGQTYTLPWGQTTGIGGIYRDTIRSISGCDSIRRTVNLSIQTAVSQIINASICMGQNYTLPWGTIVNVTGVYRDTLHYTTGCDSVWREVNLTVPVSATQTFNPVICAGQTYTLPWGTAVSAAGVYRDTLRYIAGCDSIRRVVTLTVQGWTVQTFNLVICSGQAYTLPWGTVVSATGIYRDTLHYITTGCDSVRRVVNLTVQNWSVQTLNPVICSGQNYTLPWGTVVNATGVYHDTLHYTTGCDSIRRVVNLTVQDWVVQTTNAVMCQGQNYTLPWGAVVTIGGIYRDTLRYTTGCDSIRRIVDLTVQGWTVQTLNPVICSGQTYTLPWGTVVNATGVYRDTLHHVITGCDSVRREVNLTVQNWTVQTFNPVICSGQTYTLPWGTVVNVTGVYRDTLHYTTGCDSIRREVNLVVQDWTVQTSNPVICAGQTYTLPWGTVVNATGVYRDTLHYVTTGCDSVRRVVNLTVHDWTVQTLNPVICSGQNYTLPWGTVVNATGVYLDTLHYVITGCDSIRRVVNLTVQNWTVQTFSPIICAGQSYTLPWGTVVSTAGIYYDTLHYTTGCDSIRREVNLTVQNWTVQTLNPVICAGQSYTLPWGAVVNATGVYRDTLHYINTGCDSIRRVVNLTVQNWTVQTFTPVICSGQTYTLPWGTVVNATGIYRDTLHYVITGCDSVRRVVALTVQNWTVQTFNPIICAGQTYTLPWGTVVNTAGMYHDTLHYTTGCDSIRRVVNLTVQNFTIQASSAVICQGATYTLPWGTVVNVTGVYRDTLRYVVTGCDSIRRVVNVTVQNWTAQTINASICQGGSYTLPWGLVTSTAGVYRDTLHYTTGCDSIRRVVNLQVIPALRSNSTAVICSNETYTLPWGMVVNRTGVYKDTVHTLAGCDSLIRTIDLTVNPVPTVAISKSNDVDCMMGISRLEASGGIRYTWTPSGSTNNPTFYNPTVSPSTTTWYKVEVSSDKGCTTKDSIQVKVITGSVENGYLVPNAFTPNGDGKNDCFGVQTWGFVTDFSFSIYSRWGERVFYTTDPRQCWDGRYKGTEQSSNVFVYQISAKGFCGAIFRKGTFTLIR